jgi:hypothetical protein
MNNLYYESRQKVINEMIDCGYILRLSEDHYEDLGGHTLHDSHLDEYIKNFLATLDSVALKELMSKIRGSIDG